MNNSQSWPMWWRITALVNLSVYNMMNNVFAAGIAPLFGLIMEEFHCDLQQVSQLSSYTLLMLGLANLYLIIAVSFIGRRLTILISLSVLMGSNIWAAKATSFQALLITRFLGGISGGVVEGLAPLMIAEMFPRDQMGKAMVVYVFFTAAGSSLGSMFSGIIAQSLHDWRWFFTICAIILGANLSACLLMLPETYPIVTPNGEVTNTPNAEHIQSKLSDHDVSATHVEMGLDETVESFSLLRLWIERSFYPHIFISRQKRFYILWINSFRLFLTPEVLTTMLFWAACVGWVLVSAIISSAVYQKAPYFWSSEQVGLLNLGPFLGLVLGFPLGGIVADRFISSRSDGEVRRAPKARLPLLLPGAVISPIGCLLMGLTLHYTWHWIGFAAGFGMLAFSVTSSCNILLTYSVDTFRLHAAQIGLVVNMTKYILSFGMTFGVIDWYVTKGPLSQFGTMAGTLWAIYFLSMLLYFLSKPVARISCWALSSPS
ncbi:major facilitator superfamily domain-containing protein [Talaromyces proteolyticus]|uniref:Major facilitator superfamily domain-containing protein n=1 Tax=Talaromyces proteolyticus TaxID=1131652 RepID=A0AAD4KYS8_9EURO|nr:major facilitator superfamily domain-containing protein [Talaromyces proteolyticus]KAH8700320.1 major facilitator superfamily domain-containing protein [Talaromyces proteolyticus]